MNKGLRFIIALGVLFICLSPCAYSQLRRSMRQIPIGNSDYQGYARMDKIFYRMPLGDGKLADFFFKFTSDPSLEPKYMEVITEHPILQPKAKAIKIKVIS